MVKLDGIWHEELASRGAAIGRSEARDADCVARRGEYDEKGERTLGDQGASVVNQKYGNLSGWLASHSLNKEDETHASRKGVYIDG